jgi:hypothetical protein
MQICSINLLQLLYRKLRHFSFFTTIVIVKIKFGEMNLDNCLDVAQKLNAALSDDEFVQKLYARGALKLTAENKPCASLLNHTLYSEQILGYDEQSIKDNWLWYKLKAGILTYKRLTETYNSIQDIVWTASITNSKTVADFKIILPDEVKDISIKHYSPIPSYICTKELAGYHLLFEEEVVDRIQKSSRRQLYESVSTVLDNQFNKLSTREMMTKIGEAIVNNNEIITNTLANMIMHKDYVENANLIVYNTSYRYCRDITSLLTKLANSFRTAKKSIYFEDQITMMIEHQYDDDHLAEYILKYKPRSKTFVFYIKL